MKNYLMGLALASMVYSATGCTNSADKTAGNTQEVEETERTAQTTQPKFADAKVNKVYQHYIHLKTALVNNDAKEADMGAKMLEKALTKPKVRKATKISKSANEKRIQEKKKAGEIKAGRKKLDY